MSVFGRWLRFNAVGAGGVLVQSAALAVLLRLHMHYLPATCMAVELAILHNFALHERWTWRDRLSGSSPGRLLRFHAANGCVSLGVNAGGMRLLVGALHLPVLGSDLACIATASLLNFFLGDRLVFAPAGGRSGRSRPCHGPASPKGCV